MTCIQSGVCQSNPSQGEGVRVSGAERSSQLQKAVIELRTLVMSGALPAGQRISEVALSEQIGISRTPLREAMARLGAEGLLERGTTSGWRVRIFGLEDIRDAIELRGVIEGTVARIAAERGYDPARMAACEQILERIDQTVPDSGGQMDFDGYVALNAEFHDCLVALCPSPMIRSEMRRTTRLPFADPSAFIRGQSDVPSIRISLYTAQAQHRSLIEAITAREGTRAEAIAREHAHLALRNLEYMLRCDPRLMGRVPGMSLVAAGD